MSIAAYALGTLDDDERTSVAEHLTGCAACRARREEVGGLAGLLATVPREVARAGLPAPEPRILDRVLAAASTEAARRRRRRRLLVAAAAVVVLLVGAGLAQLTGGMAREPAGLTVAGAQGPVQAQVHLQPAGEGTDLALELSGVASAQTCRLVVVSPDGGRDVAATWEASYSGTATIRGHTAVDAGQIDRLVVETLERRTLVEIPVP